MQTVERCKSFFYLDIDLLAVIYRLFHTGNRSALLPKGFHHRQSPDIFDYRTGHILNRFFIDRRIFLTLHRYPVKKQQRKQDASRRNQRSGNTKHAKAENNCDYIYVAVDNLVDHPHTLIFQSGQLRGDGA